MEKVSPIEVMEAIGKDYVSMDLPPTYFERRQVREALEELDRLLTILEEDGEPVRPELRARIRLQIIGVRLCLEELQAELANMQSSFREARKALRRLDRLGQE